jgi:hypothetical protein
MRIGLSLTVLCLCGCAHTMVWDKAGATQLEFAQAKYQCMQESQSAGNYMAAGAPLFVLAASMDAKKRGQGMFNACMEAHGFELHRQ